MCDVRLTLPRGVVCVAVMASVTLAGGSNLQNQPNPANPANPANRANQENLVVEALPSPAAGNSAEPQLTVSGDRALLSWLELAGSRAALKFAERSPTGWSDVRTVASGTDFMVNSADVPSVVRLADGTLAAHWLQQNGPDPESYNILLSLSKDEGRTWSRPVSPHHDGK